MSTYNKWALVLFVLGIILGLNPFLFLAALVVWAFGKYKVNVDVTPKS